MTTFRKVQHDDLESIVRLEQSSYDAADAASREQIELRLSTATNYFYVLESEKEIIGFINGTRCYGAITHEAMAVHIPEGENLCIHSVVVAQQYRRQGLALQMVKEYCNIMCSNASIKCISLLARPPITELYAKAGFVSRGISSIQHGKQPWEEMVLQLKARA